MTDTAVAADFNESLDIESGLTAKVTLEHPFVLGDHLKDLIELFLREVLGAHIGRQASFFDDQVGTIRATLSVTDQDGESDCTSFDVDVGQSEPVTIQFTEITPEAITFRIPSTAKGNDYQVWTSTRLAAHDSEWVDWLPIAGSNLVAGGQFRAISLQVPSFEVPIEVTDGSEGSSFIRVDISEIFRNHSNHYFRIELPAPSPGE